MFYFNNENINKIIPINNDFYFVKNISNLYNIFLDIWDINTCATRLREQYDSIHKSLGQCSISAFLIQDIFGGDVFGVKLDDGNFHCFNKIGDVIFDLTSEQFTIRNIELNYTLEYPQNRENHFKKQEKYERYLLLKQKLFNYKNMGVLI